MKTRIFTLLVATMFATQCLYAYDVLIDGIEYDLNEAELTAEVTNLKYSDKYSGDITIPSTVTYSSKNYSVTGIGGEAFYNCTGLTSINIPNSVTSIGDWAFEDCKGLTSINIPNSVTIIGEGAFKGCTRLPVIDNIRYADTFLVEAVDKSLPSYTIKDGTKWIGYNAFEDCKGLTSINIPNSVTSIEDDAFSGCTGLPVINNIRYADTFLVEAVDKSLPSYTIKDGTKWIGYGAFWRCERLTSINIPNSVTSIGYGAFSDCTGLTSINIPNSVTNIGRSAFYNCTGLTSINIPNSVTSIGDGAFAGCTGLTSINIPNSVTSIGSNAFAGCTGLTSINIPNSVTSIGSNAFSGCTGLTSINIPNSVTSIGYDAFNNCTGLISITIPSSVTSIVSSTIGKSPVFFEGCVNLEIINNDCSMLTISELSSSSFKSIKTINSCASFFDVTEDEWFMCPNTVPNIKITSGELTENAFAVINRNYKTLKTLDIEDVDNTELADEAFKGCYNLESLKLPKKLTKIGYMTVADCKKLQEINVPASVTDIDDSAFENCRSMKTLTFGSGSAMKTAEESQLQRIGNWSFYNCHELQNLDIPEGVTEVGLAAFYGCTYLQNLTLPSTLRTIGDNTFAKCEKLAGLRCAAEVPPTIDAKTFEDVDRTIPVTVPQGSLKAYKEDIYWSEFINLKEETTDAKEIPAEFENIGIVDGTVTYSGNEPFSIHNLNGQDVTNLNGSLNGIHIITIGTASQNMLVK